MTVATRPLPPVGTPLTPIERNVLRMVADGRTNGWIGRKQNISEDTVKSHMRRILHKLGARDRTHAVVLAQAAGELPCACQTPAKPRGEG